MLSTKTQRFLRVSALAYSSLLSFYVIGGALIARDLWVDHNPYSPSGRIVVGSILKLSIDEPMTVEYEFQGANSEEAKVKMTPDKSLTEFLPPANVDKNTQNKQDSRARSRARVKFRMGVQVTRVTETGIEFTGNKMVAPEEGRTRFQVQVQGQVNREDIQTDRTIKSEDVSELQVLMRGGPVPQNKNLPMKQTPGTTTQGPGLSAQPTAEEKEQMLLDYLNRIFGESRDF